MKFSVLLLVLVSSVVDRCTQYSREEFNIERSLEGTNAFRTSGLYYNTYSDFDGGRTSYMVFYQNGVVFGGSIAEGTLDSVLVRFHSKQHMELSYALPYYWGIYNVSGKELRYEKWKSFDAGPYSTWVYDATILNDTTLLFANEYFGEMHFYPLAEKPDSINPFIK